MPRRVSARALERAAARGIPVVALKVGHGEFARRMVTAHSGAIAGEDAAYEALFEHTGVLRVRGLDEMADTVELLCAGPRGGCRWSRDDPRLRRGADASDRRRSDVWCAARGDQRGDERTTCGNPRAGLPAVNPLDAWDTSRSAHDVFTRSLQRCTTIRTRRQWLSPSTSLPTNVMTCTR